jgi:hypothetical protein
MPVEPVDRSDTTQIRTVTPPPHRGVRIARLAAGGSRGVATPGDQGW